MSTELFWEDVTIGDELPELIKKPTRKQIVMWAGAVDQYGEQHYDNDFAIRMGLPGVILHGSMKGAFLMQMFTDCIGVNGCIRRLAWADRRPDFPGKTITCKARVARKYITEGKACLDCEIWIENEEHERTSEGTATISLPQKPQPLG